MVTRRRASWTSRGERDGSSIHWTSKTDARMVRMTRYVPDLASSQHGPKALGSPPSSRRVGECSVRRASTAASAEDVSLNHVITTDSYGLNPFTANPFTANPFTANPFTANPFTANAPGVGIGSYGALGFGGRQPVPIADPTLPSDPQRVPVVAVFDTGLGSHSGSRECASRPRASEGDPIGIRIPLPIPRSTHRSRCHSTASSTTPRVTGRSSPASSGRSARQARILPVRVANGEGIILENELIGALKRLIVYIEQVPRVHVLNLSFSFYHETPDDPTAISAIAELLGQLRDDHDVVVVCSAGNEATDRPTYPERCRTRARGTSVWEHSIRQTTPSPSSRTSETGSMCMPRASRSSRRFRSTSTAASRQAHATTSTDADARRLMPTTSAGGYGVWSGTSFAAPVVAGRIAAQVADGSSSVDAVIAVLADLDSRDHSR